MLSSLMTGGYIQRGLTLSVTVGVMLSLFVMRSSADENAPSVAHVEEILGPASSQATNGVGDKNAAFACSAHAEIDANYLWRGLYCGGLSIQAEADVSYYGFFANMWWNIGASDWNYGKRDAKGVLQPLFNPEVDVAIGYHYKGLQILFIHMYYFDRYADGRMSHYFDWGNHAQGGGGVTTEWRVSYHISDQVPLRLLWCTRTFGRDGYMSEGVLKRAYSTYIEARYDQVLPCNFMLSAVIGVTPWRSLYTQYNKGFAVTNLSVELDKSWQMTECCDVNLGGVLMFNPSSMTPLWNVRVGVSWH